MSLDLISSKDIQEEDTRDSKKRYLETDGICIECGTITNNYYNDNCLICKCKSREFISGRISIDIRHILDIHIQELRVICEFEGLSTGSRSQMTINLIRKIYPQLSTNPKYKKVDDTLIRKIIIRNRKKFYYIIDLEDMITKNKKSKEEQNIVVTPKFIKLIEDSQ